ncbi:MAG: hypothetical protein ACOC6Q_02015 [Patescibacteria group bacterium]
MNQNVDEEPVFTGRERISYIFALFRVMVAGVMVCVLFLEDNWWKRLVLLVSFADVFVRVVYPSTSGSICPWCVGQPLASWLSKLGLDSEVCEHHLREMI